MSYNIGQLRKSEISSYGTNLNYTSQLVDNENSIITFKDYSLLLRGDNVVSSLYTYYIKFKVKQMANSIQEFTVKLSSDEVETDNEEELRTLKVKQGIDEVSFELVFTPNATYNEIIFKLSRTSLDFYTYDEDTGYSGRIMDIEIVEFTRLVNVITSYLSKNYSGLTELKKIGIQGPPGLLFTINGEQMQIGRRGIYELDNDNITITYIGFVIKDSLFTQDGEDYFIMDFKY